MDTPVPLPFATGFYESPVLPLAAQECLNWYVHAPDGPALAPEVLFPTPGISAVVSRGDELTDANRGGWSLNGVPYFVNGSALVRLNADDTLDALGTIGGTGRVSMSDNGTQLMILAPGVNGYIFTTGPDALTTISDADFTANGNPQAVVFVDTYFVFTTDANKFIISASNNGLAYDALDFGTAESNPDGTQVPIVFKNQLFIIGEITAEGFSNVGGADFPFQRSGVFLDQGTPAPHSVVKTSETFLFIGNAKNESPAVWAFAGNTTQKVSTQAIDDILEDLTAAQLADVFAWSYAQSGHYFVGFTLPTTTLVFDTTTGKWHERKSRYIDASLNTIDVAYRVSSVVAGYGSMYVSDSLDGRIGLMDPDNLDEYTNRVFRRVATQPFQDNTKSFSVPYLELTMESGVGNAAEPDPMVVMDRSTDGGKTWVALRARAMGKEGEYKRRIAWRRNGRASRFEVFRFSTSAPVKAPVLGLHAIIMPQQ